jgi:hypothetical protein
MMIWAIQEGNRGFSGSYVPRAQFEVLIFGFLPGQQDYAGEGLFQYW